MQLYRNRHVALVVPCFNEGIAIGQVIDSFRESMSELSIFVFDNNSTDDTSAKAKAHGAEVVMVKEKGKGSVVRRMFSDVEADIYVMVDGDATYDAKSVVKMVDKLIDEKLDMVVGCRETSLENSSAAYRAGHQWGNKALTGSVKQIFGGEFSDMLSGYRVFSKRFAKSFPALSKGFEIETELTVHALELRMPWGEVKTPYGARPEGSTSKLSTYRDGWRILKTIFKLYVRERPLQFFSIVSFLLLLSSVVLFVPILFEYLETGLVSRIPTAVLCASIAICALLSLTCGLIVDNMTRARHELKRLAYLIIPWN
ncbi:TPA: glycosyltransferase [Vibrio cholerae]|nr:putative glycosyltransferase [Vibrio mimicus]HAS3607713.1 glycosyltransferase [Vibrio cholerae]